MFSSLEMFALVDNVKLKGRVDGNLVFCMYYLLSSSNFKAKADNVPVLKETLQF